MEFSPTSKGKNITIRTYRLIIKISKKKIITIIVLILKSIYQKTQILKV